MATVIRGAVTPASGRRTLGGKAPSTSQAVQLREEPDSPMAPPSTSLDEAQGFDIQQLQELTARCEELERRLEQVNSQIESLQAEADTQWKAAREEGMASGREEGLREISATETAKLKLLDTVTDALDVQQKKLFDTVESLAVEIGFAAVTKICGRAATDTELLANMVQQSLASLREEARIKLRLPPADVKRLQVYRDSGGSALNWEQIDLVADTGLAPGACVVSGRAGTLQAGLDLQLRNLKELLLATYAQSAKGQAT